MIKLNTGVGIEQGDCILFSDFENNGKMWTGHGARERRTRVKFQEAFRHPPAVHCGPTLWDIDSGANGRVDLCVDKITETGFEIVFRTWADTRIARLRVSWMAIGALRDDEDWELY